MVWPRVVLERIPPQLDALIARRPDRHPVLHPVHPDAGRAPRGERSTGPDRRTAHPRAGPARVPPAPGLRRRHLPPRRPGRGGRGPLARGSAALRLVASGTTPPPTITAEQAHQLGLSEVARIRAEMEAVKARAGFKGTLAEFFQHLRTDPRYFYKTGDELLLHSRDLAKRSTRSWSGSSGAAPAALRRRADPGGHGPGRDHRLLLPGRRGRLARRHLLGEHLRAGDAPRWEMVPLTLHEAVPGHHLQVSLAAGAAGPPGLPPARATYAAFGEGWGLYSESLGRRARPGTTTRTDEFGQLTYEMWRAVRLVVDTGMHAEGLDPGAGHPVLPGELARAPSWTSPTRWTGTSPPGQALAYKIGS